MTSTSTGQPVHRRVGYTPAKDNVLIEVRQPRASLGYIHIPDVAIQQGNQGYARAVGPKVKHVKKGDSLMFDKFAGSELEISGKTHRMMREKDVQAIVEEDPSLDKTLYPMGVREHRVRTDRDI